MQHKVNLADAVSGKLRNGVFSKENPKITLFFKMEVKIEGEVESKPPFKAVSPQPKRLTFED